MSKVRPSTEFPAQRERRKRRNRDEPQKMLKQLIDKAEDKTSPWMNKLKSDYNASDNLQRNSTKIIHVNTKISKRFRNQRSFEQFPGRAPVDPKKLEKYSRGVGVTGRDVKSNYHKTKILKHDKKIEYAKEQAARSELLLTEETGYLETEKGDDSCMFTQQRIAEEVDITSATKYFSLDLKQFGPYKMNYSRHGRSLVLGGRMGHVAAFDWVTKKLYCEVNVMDSVYEVRWLHTDTMFAVAQKKWVFIYDTDGIELHCLKKLHKVIRMEFLPYHFLLATASEEGYLSWLDVSIGEMVAQYNTKMGRLNLMAQNPYNAILCVGHSKGTVSMWSPNMNTPVAKMLCHKFPLQSLAVDPKGMYMATADIGSRLRIWDVRMLEGPVQHYKLQYAPQSMSFSQQGMLALGMGNVVEVYRNPVTHVAQMSYLQHRVSHTVGNLEFCPYEDVLGVATGGGFTSMLVPGSGEPNFDALEVNPYQSKSQRRETEVKALLEKIQPEMISLDPAAIIDVNLPSMKEKIEAKKKLLYAKPPEIDFTPRVRAGKRKGSAHAVMVKRIVKEGHRREFVKVVKTIDKDSLFPESAEDKIPSGPVKPASVLDRFKPKKTLKSKPDS